MHKLASKKTPQHILLAGLGSIGGGVAYALQQDGMRLSAIRRQSQGPAGIDIYAQDLITAPALLLPPDPVDLLIIVLTPPSRDAAGYRRAFLEAPQRLLDGLAQRQPLPPVIFVSSSAVFGNQEGEVGVHTPPTPDSFNGRILLAAEEEISTRSLATCVRLTGIYGRGDYRRRQLHAIVNNEAALPECRWMNRIHYTDAIGLLHHLAMRWLEGDAVPPLVIGCDNQPVSNHLLLRELAEQEGVSIDLPAGAQPSGKRIHSDYIAQGHYQLQH